MFKKIYIEITNICNKNCSFCPPSKKVKKEMSLGEFETTLKHIDSYTNYVYLHIKGEPLMHSNFEDIIKLCEKYNKFVNITTNGTLLLKHKDILLNKTVKRINISLHSFEKANDNYIDDITYMINYLKQNEGLNIQLRFWALNDNTIGESNTLMLNRLCDNLKIDNVLDKINNEKNIKLQDRLYLNKGDLFKWPEITDPYINDTGTCYGVIDHVGILSDGTVIPCCLDQEGVINLGNIFATSMDKIVKTDRFLNMKNNFHNRKVVEDLCQRCLYRCNLKQNNKK